LKKPVVDRIEWRRVNSSNYFFSAGEDFIASGYVLIKRYHAAIKTNIIFFKNILQQILFDKTDLVMSRKL
jgi:hypothetical protein